MLLTLAGLLIERQQCQLSTAGFMGSFQLEQEGLTLHGQAVAEVVTTPVFFFVFFFKLFF